MADTDATSTSSGAGMIATPTPAAAFSLSTSNRNAGSSSSSSSRSASDFDGAAVQPLPACLAADTAPDASSSSADANLPAVRPPLHVQPLQFARRAVGVGGMSPRTAPPHASPRVNSSLTPRGRAAANQNLHLSDVTDSSSDDEPLRAKAAHTTAKPPGAATSTAATQQQAAPDAQDSLSIPARHVSARPVAAPGAIISRQPSVAEEERRQPIAQGSKPGRMRLPPADAAATPTVGPAAAVPAPQDEEQGPPFADKVHTRCRCRERCRCPRARLS
jgi:hypothetical protein